MSIAIYPLSSQKSSYIFVRVIVDFDLKLVIATKIFKSMILADLKLTIDIITESLFQNLKA